LALKKIQAISDKFNRNKSVEVSFTGKRQATIRFRYFSLDRRETGLFYPPVVIRLKSRELSSKEVTGQMRRGQSSTLREALVSG
jgi:hypothetical protein